MNDKPKIKAAKLSIKEQTELGEEFNQATKIGVFKELHRRGLISDQELSTLIYRTKPIQ